MFQIISLVSIKSGNKELINNYRPISLLSCLSKPLEKLIKGRLVKCFDKNHILYDRQYGFRDNDSITHALLDVITNSFIAFHNNKNTALLLMDLRKASDTVSHSILLQNHYGMRGPAHALIESYLSSRYQFVIFNNFLFP